MTGEILRLPPVRLPVEALAPMAEAKALRLEAAGMEARADGRLQAAARLRFRAARIEAEVFARISEQRGHAASPDEAARS